MSIVSRVSIDASLIKLDRGIIRVRFITSATIVKALRSVRYIDVVGDMENAARMEVSQSYFNAVPLV